MQGQFLVSLFALLAITPNGSLAGRAPRSRKLSSVEGHSTSMSSLLPPTKSPNDTASTSTGIEALNLDPHSVSNDIRKAMIKGDLSLIRINKKMSGEKIYNKLSSLFTKYPNRGGQLMLQIKKYLQSLGVGNAVISVFEREMSLHRRREYDRKKKAQMAQEGFSYGIRDRSYYSMHRTEEFVKYLHEGGFDYENMTPEDFFKHWIKVVREGNAPFSAQEFGHRLAAHLKRKNFQIEWRMKYRKIHDDGVRRINTMEKRQKRKAERGILASLMRGANGSHPPQDPSSSITNRSGPRSLRSKTSSAPSAGAIQTRDSKDRRHSIITLPNIVNNERQAEPTPTGLKRLRDWSDDEK